MSHRDFPGHLVLKTLPSGQVQSLVGESRSHMAPGLKNQNIKQKQYCSKLNNKALKNGPHQNKKFFFNCVMSIYLFGLL